MVKQLQIMNSLHDFFISKIAKLPCQEITKSYIVSILAKPEKLPNLSGQSITLCFEQAKTRQDFASFQNLADWLLFQESIHPDNLKDVEQEYYFTVAQISYYNCFKMTRRQLLMYEELSDSFVTIVMELRHQVYPDHEDIPINYFHYPLRDEGIH